MKHSILLISLFVGCVTSHAQTSVSLSGTVDLMAQRVTGSLSSRTQLSSGGNATSKLTFRGSEDLGDGVRASVWLETGLGADSGAGQVTNVNNQPGGAGAASGGLTFNRRSIVAIAGPWGALHLGRDWSPTYDIYTGKLDPFALSVGIGLNYTASINPAVLRVSNDIAYLSPNINGFSAHLHHWLGENASSAANARDGTGDGIRLGYDAGPLMAIVALTRTRFVAGDAITRAIGASYAFPRAKVSFNLNRDEQAGIKQRGWLVGAWVPAGAGEFKVAYSSFNSNTAGNPEGRKIAVGYVHNLSKRTALYTTYARILNSHGSKLAIAGASTAPNAASSGLDLGLRHNF